MDPEVPRKVPFEGHETCNRIAAWPSWAVLLFQSEDSSDQIVQQPDETASVRQIQP